jgi:hypothetical protein
MRFFFFQCISIQVYILLKFMKDQLLNCVGHSVVLLEYLPLSVNYVHEVRLENFVSVPYCH